MKRDLESFILCTSAEMRGRRQYSVAKTCISAWRGLLAASQQSSLDFSDLTPELLAAFEHHLMTSGRSRNTVSLYMRTMQNLCHRAWREGIATVPDDLFDKVFTGAVPAQHRAIAPELIRQISSVVLVDRQKRLQFARDMFMLSFYLRGISYIDLAHLRKSDLKEGIISYWRQKTKKTTSLRLEPCAMEIIERYAHLAEGTIYLLPIIRVQGTADEEQKQYESALRLYNKHLNRISEILNLGMPLTSYVARHSWATIASSIGVELADISQSLCHSSEKMTRNYIRSFSADRLEGVNRKVIAYVTGEKRDNNQTKQTMKQTKKQLKAGGKIRSGSL